MAHITPHPQLVDFNLWGLTLAATSDLLNLQGQKALAWPPARFANPVANFVLYALCGAAELYDPKRYGLNAAHLACTVAAVGTIAGAISWIL